MDNLLDRVISQFDTLISFLAISHEDVFDLIRKERKHWPDFNQDLTLPDSYNIFRTQIIHSAFILGYSYFEAFLTDLVREIYLLRPNMLPKEKKLKYADILKTDDYNAILELMIEKEIKDLFFKRMEEVVAYFEEKLNLNWQESNKDEIIRTSYMRNCIIHNLSKADHRLSEVSDFKAREKIELNFTDVHLYGMTARSLVRDLYNQALKKHLEGKGLDREDGK